MHRISFGVALDQLASQLESSVWPEKIHDYLKTHSPDESYSWLLSLLADQEEDFKKLVSSKRGRKKFVHYNLMLLQQQLRLLQLEDSVVDLPPWEVDITAYMDAALYDTKTGRQSGFFSESFGWWPVKKLADGQLHEDLQWAHCIGQNTPFECAVFLPSQETTPAIWIRGKNKRGPGVIVGNLLTATARSYLSTSLTGVRDYINANPSYWFDLVVEDSERSGTARRSYNELLASGCPYDEDEEV